jgi:DNA-binding transcriptional regulator YiaG
LSRLHRRQLGVEVSHQLVEDHNLLLTVFKRRLEHRNLHRAIGMYVIRQKRELTGPEFRFLRKQMRFTQKTFAERTKVDVQTIANYEKGKKFLARLNS